jgi:diguanylate cyclase (GGDEF)-like protein
MRLRRRDSVRERVEAVRAWPLWEHPPWLRAYIVTVVAVNLLAIAVAIQAGLGTGRSFALLGILIACEAATVEFTKRSGEITGVVKDVHGVWELPVAILLPPVYALVVPILRLALVQWRVRPARLHRRVFTAAVVGLSYGAASLVFHGIMGSPLGVAVAPGGHAAVWIAAVAAAGVAQWLVNTGLLFPALKGSDPAAKARDIVLGGETVQNDVAELCVAVLVTFAIGVSMLTVVFALPFVTLLQRSFRHTQLVTASRVDSKTGLLNAATWEREAAAEVARAVRTRTPLAVALVDIDHFKGVNDTFGHLAGDRALKAIARTFRIFLRDYDLVGRFGGEEFAFLLPHTSALDAYGIAERIREHIAVMSLDVGDPPDGRQVRVTVSLGVAALGPDWSTTGGNQLTDLLAAADRGLYQAKRAGRDRVCVVSDNAVVGSDPATSRPARPARIESA